MIREGEREPNIAEQVERIKNCRIGFILWWWVVYVASRGEELKLWAGWRADTELSVVL